MSVNGVVLASHSAFVVRQLDSLDLYISDGLGNPKGGFLFAGPEKDFGCWLGQHDLGIMAVNHFKLGFALEAHNDGIPALSVLRSVRCVAGEVFAVQLDRR